MCVCVCVGVCVCVVGVCVCVCGVCVCDWLPFKDTVYVYSKISHTTPAFILTFNTLTTLTTPVSFSAPTLSLFLLSLVLFLFVDSGVFYV